MSYQIHSIEGTPEERRAAATFLADFVRDGELAEPRPGDDDPAAWERRFAWWWDDNPLAYPGVPKGLLLEHDEAGVVGFLGFIPAAYEADGEPVPSLVSTTLFVRPGHRGAVMGLLARQRALGRDYQIIDGSPSPEMRRLLGRLGFRHAGDRAQFLFPARRGGGAAARTVMRLLGWSFPLPPRNEGAKGQIVRNPGDWRAASPIDGRIRRRTDPETLSWLARVGSEPRSFFGLLDEAGEPLAHAIGVYKRRRGLLCCLLLDHHDYRPGGGGLGLLLRRLLDDPAAGLDPRTALVVLSRFGPEPIGGAPGHRAESILHYHLPPRWQGRERACLPIEGDLPLL